MNCKICGTENTKIRYKLKYANVLVCKKCGFHYTNHLDDETRDEHVNLDEVEISPYLNDYMVHMMQFNNKRFQNHVAVSEEYLQKADASKKILDVGCGGGLYLVMMREKGVDCYGIEPDLERLKFARDEEKLKNVFATTLQSDYWANNHKKSFDLVTMWDVIEHVNSPGEMLESSRELLKEGGFLLIDTPCRNSLYHRLGVILYTASFGFFRSLLSFMYSDHRFGHKQIFSRHNIRVLFEKHGFEVLKLEKIHEFSFPAKFYLKNLLKNHRTNVLERKRLVNFLAPPVQLVMNMIRTKNKMIVVGKLKPRTNTF